MSIAYGPVQVKAFVIISIPDNYIATTMDTLGTDPAIYPRGG